MAEKIDCRTARIPPPGHALYETMAIEGYAKLEEVGLFRNMSSGQEIHVSWMELADPMKEALISQARAMYGVIAKLGGGRVAELRGGL